MLLCDSHNLIHIACYSGIVDGDDDFGARSDERFDSFRIQVRIALHAISKYHLCSFAEEGKSRADKGITRDDHFITGFEIT